MVKEKHIDECPITINDIKNAHSVFDPDHAGLRGKPTKQRPEHVYSCFMEVQKDILSLNHTVALKGDVFFLNGFPFLVLMSSRIQLVSVKCVLKRTAKEHVTSLFKLWRRSLQCKHNIHGQ